jgi:hypothetical protein
MSSWKQYGGTNKGEKANDINADSIITNNLSLKKPYQGNLIIAGSLIVNENLRNIIIVIYINLFLSL